MNLVIRPSPQTPSMHLVLPAALLPDVQSDAVRLLLRPDQVHVVGDEELTGTGYRGTPRWHEQGGAEVRGPIRTLQLEDRKFQKIITRTSCVVLSK